MAFASATVKIPLSLVQEIDALVGEQSREAFLITSVKSELRRRRLHEFLSSGQAAWQDQDHPEIVTMGVAAWVHELRRTTSARRQHLEDLFSESGK